MPPIQLSVLMPALRNRRPARQPLERELRRQMADYPGRCELLIDEDNGETPSGAKRNRLMQRAGGEYIAQVDDDDQVAGDYVQRLLTAITHRPDAVTFNLRRLDVTTRKARLMVLSIHYLADHIRLGPWPARACGMSANHLCAWRRDVATLISYPPDIGYNDDCSWYKPLLRSGLVQTEVHVDRVLYHYHYHPAETRNQAGASLRRTFDLYAPGVECFLATTDAGRRVILPATRHFWHTAGRDPVEVRTPDAGVITLPRDRLTPFYVWKPT